MTKQEVSLRKKQIIDATIECISHYGYHGFSMQDVARNAHISKGIIHYYFLNKEDLLSAVRHKIAEEIEENIYNRLKGLDPFQNLLKMVEFYFHTIKEKKERYSINIDLWSQINHRADIKQEIASQYAKFRHEIASVIECGIEKGAFRNTNPHLMASTLLAFIDGIALQWIFDEHAFQFEEIMKHCEEIILNFLKKK